MKRRSFLKHSIAAGLATVITPGGIMQVLAQSGSTHDLARAFKSPPRSAGAHTWWHWMNGHVTKQGITQDLEAMHEIGLGGFQNFNVGSGIPKGPIEYLSPEWLELTRHAIRESERLGLEYQMHNCPGWSSTGGPWITPELSMQQVTWSETFVKGGSRVSQQLPKPFHRKGYYRDTFTLAFPSASEETSAWDTELAQVSLDGNPVDKAMLVHGSADKPLVVKGTKDQPKNLVLTFNKPVSFRSVLLYANAEKDPMGGGITYIGPVLLEVSNDGTTFSKVCTIDAIGGETPGTNNFKSATGKYFRLVFPANSNVYQVAFSSVARNEDWLVKGNYANGTMNALMFPKMEKGTADRPAPVIAMDSIIDLSDKVGEDGILNWQAPAGNWTILRFGHTATARINKAAPTTGEGLECDKYDAAAFDFHFDKMFEQLLGTLKPLVGKSKVGVLIDSYEVGMQNWTKAFPALFRKSRGYELLRYLPALTGRVVASTEVTDGFLWDLRRVQSDLMADNYYGRCTERCHEHGFESYTEPYNGGPLEQMQVGSRMDVNMGEFWVRSLHFRHSMKLASSIQHINGRKIVGAESFTGHAIFSKWQEFPYAMKAHGDLMYTKGLNRFIFHRYAHQPHPDALPGMTMGPWGIHFDRTTTWWKPGAAWLKYVTRCQYMLQEGLFAADLLYFTGSEAPGEDISFRANPNPAPPAGYDYDNIHSEALLSRVTIKNKTIMLPDGMSYRLLILPQSEYMSLDIARKLKELVQAGMVLVGPKPKYVTGLTHTDAELKQVADELWGTTTNTKTQYGQGVVYNGLSLEDVVAELSLKKDFDFVAQTSDPSISYIHRKIGDAEVYFVTNARRRKEHLVCSFRVEGRQPELWDADAGTTRKIGIYESRQGITNIPLTLDPFGSAFIVFTDKTNASSSVVSLQKDGKVLATCLAPAVVPVPGYKDVVNNFTLSAWIKPECEIAFPGIDNPYLLRFKGTSAVFAASQDGEKLYGKGHAICGLTAGRNGFVLFERNSEGLQHNIVKVTPLSSWTHIALVYKAGVPSVYLNGKLSATGTASGFQVHPGIGDEHIDNMMTFFEGDMSTVQFAKEAWGLERIQKEASKRSAPAQGEAVALHPTSSDKILAWENGKYTTVSSGGTRNEVVVSNLPKEKDLSANWEVSFPANLGAPATVRLPKLISLHEHEAEGVKYFSGTATYSRNFDFDQKKAGTRTFLDLGEVSVIAEVSVNGRAAGIAWKAPFQLDITDLLVNGSNKLEVKVTNLWPNRLIGDEQQAPDNEYTTFAFNQMGGINEMPQWYVDGKPKPPSARVTFTTWKHYHKDSPLLQSGLVGPVTIRSASELS